jgi:hypothetical protein
MEFSKHVDPFFAHNGRTASEFSHTMMVHGGMRAVARADVFGPLEEWYLAGEDIDVIFSIAMSVQYQFTRQHDLDTGEYLMVHMSSNEYQIPLPWQ